MKLKRKISRTIIKFTFLSLLVTIVTIITVLLFPQKLFAYKMTYKEFTVCSNNKIDSAIMVVLDNAMDLVKRSELYDSIYHYNIILCHNTFYNKIDNKLIDHRAAATPRLHNVLIKIEIDPKHNKAFPTFPDSCELNLTNLLAHEMIHCLQANKYGIKKFNPFHHPEFWKLEGYPEYVANQSKLSNSSYNLRNEIDRYLDLEKVSRDKFIPIEDGGCKWPGYYLKGRLMIEYLMDIKHLSYHQILMDTISEGTVYKKMINWKKSPANN